MKKFFFIPAFLYAGLLMAQMEKPKAFADKQMIRISREVLQDKIKGGWAGQTIGVTYGGPYEFRFLGKMISDTQQLKWPDGAVKKYFDQEPGLYDDIYMDLSFVDVIEKYGADAPVDSFANAFANAAYPLWHANQAGRYNILHGIKAPMSGYWEQNPHADDIDFQIESDFAGLMFPGMCNSAAKLCDKVGHIMNYGDGWYGGVYIASMYSQAFVSRDIHFIVTEALKMIPQKSLYYQCMSDVISWHQQFPADWKKTWQLLEDKWTIDHGCTDGALQPFDISARINSAYVLMGLLYGNGDFSKTMEIAIRCGQDADCNPSSAAGILGTVIGYRKIPDYWKKNLKEVEDRNFVFTNISLNKMYAMGFSHALQMISRQGGRIDENNVAILYQKPVAVKFEQSFPGMVPSERRSLGKGGFVLKDFFSIPFEGNGITVSSGMSNEWNAKTDFVFQVEADLDGKKEIIALPYDFRTRKNEVFSKFNLLPGKHLLSFHLLNPDHRGDIILHDAIIYKPISGK